MADCRRHEGIASQRAWPGVVGGLKMLLQGKELTSGSVLRAELLAGSDRYGAVGEAELQAAVPTHLVDLVERRLGWVAIESTASSRK